MVYNRDLKQGSLAYNNGKIRWYGYTPLFRTRLFIIQPWQDPQIWCIHLDLKQGYLVYRHDKIPKFGV